MLLCEFTRIDVIYVLKLFDKLKEVLFPKSEVLLGW